MSSGHGRGAQRAPWFTAHGNALGKSHLLGLARGSLLLQESWEAVILIKPRENRLPGAACTARAQGPPTSEHRACAGPEAAPQPGNPVTGTRASTPLTWQRRFKGLLTPATKHSYGQVPSQP